MVLPTRRAALGGLLAAGLTWPASADPAGVEALRRIEARTGGRLGVCVGGEGAPLLAWRADERFPLCSTFKVLAAGAILARVDAGRERLDRALTLREADLLAYAPICRKAVEAGGGTGHMTVAEACAAAVEWSDNTAANVLLNALDGPAGLTRWVRGTGDAVSRLDRTEPTLNTAMPGDPRDTTSPAAIRDTLARILLGEALAPSSRAQLERWMVGAQTGFKRLRAGLPPDWTVGDKTGTGENGTFNTVAILQPPGQRPLFAAVYLTGAHVPAPEADAAHAEIGRLIAARVVGREPG
jgi:beta-lactamase class A